MVLHTFLQVLMGQVAANDQRPFVRVLQTQSLRQTLSSAMSRLEDKSGQNQVQMFDRRQLCG